MSEDLAAVLFLAAFHVRAGSVLASIRGPHYLRKVLAVVGLSAVPAELPDSNFNQCSRAAGHHLVAGNRGTVLSGLGCSCALLLFCSGAAHCDRCDLSFSSAALFFVIAPGSSLYKRIQPPGRPDGRKPSCAGSPFGQVPPVQIRKTGVDFSLHRGATGVCDRGPQCKLDRLLLYRGRVGRVRIPRAFLRTEMAAAV